MANNLSDAFKQQVMDFVGLNGQEGTVPKIYLDTKGIPTVGVGLALVIQDRDKTWHVRDDTP